MSPLSNLRTDEYRGDYEGRTRYLKEIITETRKHWPQHKPLFLRISCSDLYEGGWTIDDSIKLSKEVRTMGVDVIDCSSGGLDHRQQFKMGPNYQVPFAEAIKKENQMYETQNKELKPFYVQTVGSISEPLQAEEILFNERADLVAIARQLLRDPFWPIHAAEALGCAVHHTPQYEWATAWK